jgi:group I intron endonuclease
MAKSGIYKITNVVTGKFYIGSSVNIEQRFNEHKSMLVGARHPNPILQHSWNTHGPAKFTFEIVEECPNDQQTCLLREQYYLDLFKPYLGVGFNIAKQAYGGDNFTHHPNKEELREKNRIMSLGDKNGMFGKTHTKKSI